MSQRVGLIGCGVIAHVYVEKLKALPFVDLVACASLREDRAAAFAAKHGIPRQLSVENLLTSDTVDVVLNLTVPLAHHDISRRAIAAGKHVFSEKPLGLDVVQARDLVDSAQAAGVRLGCAPDTFLGAGLQTCRKLVDDGAIGEVVAASAFTQSEGPESWHPGPEMFYQRGAGPLFDMGPYYLTALVVLLGPARRVTSSARITHTIRTISSEARRGETFGVEVPTHVASVVDFASGAVGTVVTSFDVQATRYRWIELYGTEATLAVPDPNTFGGKVQIKRHYRDEWHDVDLTHGNAEQARGIGLADMLWALRSGREHRTNGRLALHVVDLMESAVRASASGQHIELSTTCERPEPLPAGLPDDTFDD